ncbi:hypothetical protein BGW36DRAFT_308633 [Talaromyces proteolyticus]|uniref:Rhodopsin domain-containing protein n=1 Tax=Talaromyces proteolyticus TaxID=1131652 RepID=A0AAD4KIS6_9EURO|nr:uncharacterized protein BGW36DRAFT_308633 [Talaromyces proteolyticus]KAH8689480.1 hypothetical protein BGW36DRAFT_308633 [Talaromyces proteolyticus]
MANTTTLIIHWIFSIIAIGLIVLRLFAKRYINYKFTLGDYLAIGAMFCVLVRLPIIHVVLIWGTNNMPDSYRQSHLFTSTEIYQRETGSKLILTDRVFYNSYLWLQKLVLLDTYRRLIRHMSWEKITLWAYGVVFAATYVVVQTVTFTECHPFDRYWIVLPDPGPCCRAQVQLIVLGVLNIVTDVMLIILPIPVLIMVRRSFTQKFQLGGLFALGLFIVAITIIRLPQNAQNSALQVNRTTWASTELLTAAIVANAPVIYGFWRGAREAGRYNNTSGETSSNRFFNSKQHSSRRRNQPGDTDMGDYEDNEITTNRVNLGDLKPGMGSSTALRSAQELQTTHSQTQAGSESSEGEQAHHVT